MKKAFSMKKIIIVMSALITALILNLTIIFPTLADYQFDQELKSNCAEFKNKNPGQELDILSIDVETGLITINQPENGVDKLVRLSYKEKDGDVGCSDESKKLFKQLKEFDEKERMDMCVDITETLAGKREMKAKNGQMPNIEGMKSYVEKNCK
jgi:hypothetical protein